MPIILLDKALLKGAMFVRLNKAKLIYISPAQVGNHLEVY